jgi:hypothetical protein
MAHHIIWNGTPDEALALLHALSTYCECRVESGRILAPCQGHLMLTHDQRAIDGMLFMRRMAARLLTEEFNVVRIGIDTHSSAATSSESNAMRTYRPFSA